jgi:hypothetical protein
MAVLLEYRKMALILIIIIASNLDKTAEIDNYFLCYINAVLKQNELVITLK